MKRKGGFVKPFYRNVFFVCLFMFILFLVIRLLNLLSSLDIYFSTSILNKKQFFNFNEGVLVFF